MGGLAATREWLSGVYAPHGVVIKPGSRRLLGWNNLGLGEDEDVVEAVVWPCHWLAADQVRFEFTALPHIVWRKRLDVMPENGKTEQLLLSRTERCVTSRVLSLSYDWPLKLQLRKVTAIPGLFKDVGPPCHIPPYPALGGCLVRVIFVAVRPHNF